MNATKHPGATISMRLSVNVELEREPDGRWLAAVAPSPSSKVWAWGGTKPEALQRLQWLIEQEVAQHFRIVFGGGQ